MTQAQILDEFEDLSIEEQIDVLASKVKILQKKLQRSDERRSVLSMKERLAKAADTLLPDYKGDRELTSFTDLDGEDFCVRG